MPKVIFHVDESGRWPMVLANATNMIHYGEAHSIPFEVEVLANSEAVRQLVRGDGSGLAEKMDSLSQAGVRFSGCGVAMKNLKIERSDLLSFVTVVPSGVVELALRQEKGYAYIRP